MLQSRNDPGWISQHRFGSSDEIRLSCFFEIPCNVPEMNADVSALTIEHYIHSMETLLGKPKECSASSIEARTAYGIFATPFLTSFTRSNWVDGTGPSFACTGLTAMLSRQLPGIQQLAQAAIDTI